MKQKLFFGGCRYNLDSLQRINIKYKIRNGKEIGEVNFY